MRKLYFIASIPATSKDGAITGVVANGMGRNATAEEVTALVKLLRTKGATPSLLDALRDDTYPGPVSAFERRSAARAEAGILNSFSGGCLFNWHTIEVGESIRKPLRQVKGWRIKYSGDYTSVCNSIDDESNLLFPTRAAAREVLDTLGYKRSKGNPSGYFTEAVYADA